jgi:hypothetical protein
MQGPMLNTEQMEMVVSKWVRIGAMFNVRPARQTPDLEELLLDTARLAPANILLFILGVTWLARHGNAVDARRLACLIRERLEPEHRPTLAFLLDCALTTGKLGSLDFNIAIEACGQPTDARPLCDVERRNSLFSQLAEQRASPLSRKWGRWMMDFDLKANALRPREWIVEQNPSLRL